MSRSKSQIPLIKPSFEETAFLAYGLYESRGRMPGREEEDWFEAEEILTLQAYVAQLQSMAPQRLRQ